MVVIGPGRVPVLRRAFAGTGAPGLDDVPGMGSGSGDSGNAKGSPEPDVPLDCSEFSEALSSALPRLMPKELAMAFLRDDLTEPVNVRIEG